MFSITNAKHSVIGAISNSICAIEVAGVFHEFNLKDIKSFNWKDNILTLGFLDKEIIIKSITAAMANKILMYLRKI